jgi:putative ABC transport system permease protein
MTWMPPGQASPIPLEILTAGATGFIARVWVALVAAATLAALIPASRGARLPVVDALRHV